MHIHIIILNSHHFSLDKIIFQQNIFLNWKRIINKFYLCIFLFLTLYICIFILQPTTKINSINQTTVNLQNQQKIFIWAIGLAILVYYLIELADQNNTWDECKMKNKPFLPAT